MHRNVEPSDLVRRLCYALSIAQQSLELLGAEGYTNPELPDNTIRPEKIVAETGLLLYVASLAVPHAPASAHAPIHAQALAGAAVAHNQAEAHEKAAANNQAAAYDKAAAHNQAAAHDKATAHDQAAVYDQAVAHPGVKQRIESVARLLIPLVRNQKILLEVCLQPALALDYAQAHIFLTRAGFPDPEFDALLVAITNVQTTPLRERFPHRMLEQEWVGRLWKNEPSDNNPIRSISLGQSLDLLHGTRDDLYAFTHAMMYVCGFEGPSPPLPRQRAEILKEAECMLARCLDDQDYDLAAEILLAWPLTKTPWSPAASFAFHVLRRVEDQVGFLPSGSTRVEQLKKLEGLERKKYFLGTSYHTIYVMGLLCAVSMRTAAAPAAPTPEVDPDPACLNRLLPYLSPQRQAAQNAQGTQNTQATQAAQNGQAAQSGQAAQNGQATQAAQATQPAQPAQKVSHPHWLPEFEKLPINDQSTLTTFLLDVALSRHVRNKNYSTVYDLLGIAMDHGIADTPMAGHAAALLDRLALIFQSGS